MEPPGSPSVTDQPTMESLSSASGEDDESQSEGEEKVQSSDEDEDQARGRPNANDGEELLLQTLGSATMPTQKYITKYVDDDLSVFLSNRGDKGVLNKSLPPTQVSRTIKAATRHIDSLKKTGPLPNDGLRHPKDKVASPRPSESDQVMPAAVVPSIIESQLQGVVDDTPVVKKRTKKKKTEEQTNGGTSKTHHFNCLPSRPCILAEAEQRKSLNNGPIPNERIAFYKDISHRIRRGKKGSKYYVSGKTSTTNIIGGRFNQLVYNQELRDLIWLEIQGYLNNRTMIEQDSYICTQRQSIPNIINQINEFMVIQRRFSLVTEPATNMCTTPRSSPIHSVSEDTAEDGAAETETKTDLRLLIDTEMLTNLTDKMTLEQKNSDPFQATIDFDDNCSCSETLSKICSSCVSAETEALNQVKELIQKIEEAESLYPCSKTLACDYPAFTTAETTSRAKSLYLFSNITRDMREKIDLLAKLFGITDRSAAGWPNYDMETRSDEITSSLSTPEIKSASEQQSHGYSFKLGATHLTPKFNFKNNQNSNGGDKTLSAPDSPESCFDVSPEVVKSKNCFFLPKQSIYRKYVDKALKHEKGLRCIHRQLSHILGPLFYRVHAALKQPTDGNIQDFSQSVDSVRSSWTKNPFPREYWNEVSTHGVWSPSYQQMGLPTFHRPFLFLLRLTVDVIHECLKLRLEQQPDQASAVSVAQLIRECKEVLKASFQIRQRYVNLAQTVLGEGGSDAIEAQLDSFDDDLKHMLQVYLRYLEQYLSFLQQASTKTTSTLKQKGYLENEWIFIRTFCVQIPEGESLAANRFCRMASRLLNSVAEYIQNGLEESIAMFTESQKSADVRKGILSSCRNFKSVFLEASSRACQASAFAKSLRKDLEFAAEFEAQVDLTTLLQKLRETGHIRVVTPGCLNYLMFVPMSMQGFEGRIWHLLDLAGGGRGIDHEIEMSGYLLVMSHESTNDIPWQGITVLLEPTIESTISLSHVQLEGILFVINQPSMLEYQCRRIEQLMAGSITVVKQPTSCNKAIANALTDLKEDALLIQDKISDFLTRISEQVDVARLSGLPGLREERSSLRERCLEVTHLGYKFAFEYHRSLTRLITGRRRKVLSEHGVSLGLRWVNFITTKCDLTAGLNRWIDQGLQFLHVVLEPQFLNHLEDAHFEKVQKEITLFMALIEELQEQTPSNDVRPVVPVLGTAPLSQPLASSLNFKRSQSVGCVNRLGADGADLKQRTRLEEWAQKKTNLKGLTIKKKEQSALGTRERIQDAVQRIDDQRQQRLRNQGLIGDVSTMIVQRAPIQIAARKVNFAWQRGFKIGEGRFGKVFTAVNNSTGELIAMKEIHLQTNDHRAVKETIDEIKTFEGIKHPNLVRYFGVEIHREDLYIFMEFCNEGTLESAVQLRLPEQLIRKYTRQLLDAVNVLHENGIVHRDIKSANIFLTSEGNLKLGDFGCCMKLKNQTTMVGELSAFVGTPAYMAPEIFTKGAAGGHGRAADIWSIGCVVLEMLTGRRPWHDLENSYQIMFKVGMGEAPEIPDDLPYEGFSFVTLCLEHEPRLRPSTGQLLGHPFIKVVEDEE